MQMFVRTYPGTYPWERISRHNVQSQTKITWGARLFILGWKSYGWWLHFESGSCFLSEQCRLLKIEIHYDLDDLMTTALAYCQTAISGWSVRLLEIHAIINSWATNSRVKAQRKRVRNSMVHGVHRKHYRSSLRCSILPSIVGWYLSDSLCRMIWYDNITSCT
jgi:hypothetical protein